MRLGCRPRLALAILAVLLTVLVTEPRAQTFLYVDVNHGSCSDATAKASNDANNPWCNIGRAVWGNASRGSPNSSEAVDAGEIVLVSSGTYDYSGGPCVGGGCRFNSVYDPVNNGSSTSARIEIRCVGACTLTAADASSPVLGTGANYIKWYADRTAVTGWIISACFEAPGAPDDCPSGTVAATPDTAAVTMAGTDVWVEGFTITGYAPAPYVDNVNAIRMENCTECTVRVNALSNIHKAAGDNHNQSGITLYAVLDSTIEHNRIDDAGSGVFFKNTGTSSLQSGNIVRYNYITNVGECFAYSLGSAGATGRNWVYQNICASVDYGSKLIDATDDWLFNNTFYDIAIGCVSMNAAAGGSRFWNNVCLSSAGVMVTAESTTMPADTVMDLEHNVYQTYSNFYSGSDGNRTFASYKATYTDQDAASPASVDQDPRLVNAAGGDFHLCTGVGTPDVGCAGASPAIGLGVDLYDLDGDSSTDDTINAGAYVTGSEVIGLVTAPTSLAIPARTFRIRGEP